MTVRRLAAWMGVARLRDVAMRRSDEQWYPLPLWQIINAIDIMSRDGSSSRDRAWFLFWSRMRICLIAARSVTSHALAWWMTDGPRVFTSSGFPSVFLRGCHSSAWGCRRMPVSWGCAAWFVSRSLRIPSESSHCKRKEHPAGPVLPRTLSQAGCMSESCGSYLQKRRLQLTLMCNWKLLKVARFFDLDLNWEEQPASVFHGHIFTCTPCNRHAFLRQMLKITKPDSSVSAQGWRTTDRTINYKSHSLWIIAKCVWQKKTKQSSGIICCVPAWVAPVWPFEVTTLNIQMTLSKDIEDKLSV